MRNILAIGASNSKKSINKEFAGYIANEMENAEVTILDWDEFILPLYSPDLEKEDGIPENVLKFLKRIKAADAIVLSLAEHNSSPTAAFKNLWDWSSRMEAQFWANKPIFLASTSPGARGGANAMKVVIDLIPRFGGDVISDFSLPSFNDNFKDGKIIEIELLEKFRSELRKFETHLKGLK